VSRTGSRWARVGDNLPIQDRCNGALRGSAHERHVESAPFDMASIVLWTIVGAGVLAAAAAFKYRADLTHRQEQIADLERRLGEARLDALRTQLHPHFLFNALNTISAHVERDPRTARWMLERLGTLLHMALEHARDQEMPLERELTFITCYMDLQKARFDDRLALVTDVAPEVLSALVPSLILQPLVENAVRHGIATGSSAGRIEIRAHRDANTLRVTVSDDGPGLPSGWNADDGFGVGLSNTQERLNRLYGKQAGFEIANLAADARASEGQGASGARSGATDGTDRNTAGRGRGVQVTVTLPLHYSPALSHDRRERGSGGEGALPAS
jgi:signal transduction histidine kinase